MTTAGRFARRTAGLAGVVVGVLLLGLLLRLDSQSLERANRLYRDGEVETASRLFDCRASREAAAARELYNAGTADLTLGEAEAASRLAAATTTEDTVVAKWAHYNLGHLFLAEVKDDLSGDSAVALLEASIGHSRTALRLDPRLEDARWNLAVALVRLDSITQLRIETDNQSSSGDDETPIDLDALTRGIGEAQSGIEPENARASEVLGQRIAAAQGAREAWASQDPGPLSEERARQLLQQVEHDPEQLIRGLMWSHRPDVAWWNSEPYPGGNW